jgi:peptidoglycan/LPS O-acetylase OafA/YrhL
MTRRADDRHRVVRERPHAYRADIDGLRALAVTAVILYHFADDLLPSGFLGVDMFFVISGYVITASLCDRQPESLRRYLLDFYGRRIKRLLPALLTSVGVTCLAAFLLVPPMAVDWRTAVTALVGASNLFLLRQSVNYFASGTELGLFSHTWSLGVEDQFYVLFPLLLWFGGMATPGSARRRRRAFWLLGGISALASWGLYTWLSETRELAAYYLMPARWWELSAGCLTFAVTRHGVGSLRRFMPIVPTAAVLALLVVFHAPRDFQWLTTCIVVCLTSVIIATLQPGTFAYRALTWRPVVTVGLASYSLYLWHWSVLAISRWTIGVHVWTVPVQLAVIALCAAGSYRFVEVPLRHARWGKTSWSPLLFGLAAVTAAAVGLVVVGRGPAATLYLGHADRVLQRLPAYADTTLSQAGGRTWTYDACVLGSSDDIGKDISTARCQFAPRTPSNGRHVLVVGNSFVVAQLGMFDALLEDGYTVTITAGLGCPPVRALEDPAWPHCQDYWRRVIPPLTAELERGDSMVMVNHVSGYAKTTPFADRREPYTILIAGAPSTQDEQVAAIRSDLMELTLDLAGNGVSVVFQDMLPFTDGRASGIQCVTLLDFLGQPPSKCEYTARADHLQHRGDFTRMLREVEEVRSNFVRLDLFDVACPEDVCGIQDAVGNILYRDESHLSRHASEQAGPILRSTLTELNRTVRAQGE